MLKLASKLLIVLVLAFSIGFVIAQEEDMVDEEAIDAITAVVVDAYGEHVNNHDAAGYVTMFTEDVLWSPPNGPDQTDAEGIQAAVQGLFDRFEFDVQPQADEVEILGNMAYVVGAVHGVLTPRSGDDPVTIHFRVIWLLGNEDGEWKIARQIWNNKPVDA